VATAIDPVCEMQVDVDNPPGGSYEYEGTTYYFCAPGCREDFAEDPGAFIRP
jgi:YHS domain-containing protein